MTYVSKAAVIADAREMGRNLDDVMAKIIADDRNAGHLEGPLYKAQIVACSSPLRDDGPTATTKATSTTKAAEEAARQAIQERQVRAAAAEIKARDGVSAEEALKRAAEQAVDLRNAGFNAALERNRKAGMSETAARKAAGDEMLAVGRAQLAKRANGRPEASEAVTAAADLIRQGRIAKDLSQVELAVEAGVTTRSVQLWEAGQSVPTGLSLWRLGDALGLTPEQVRQIGTARTGENGG